MCTFLLNVLSISLLSLCRQSHAKLPCFCPGFSTDNIAAVKAVLRKYDYNGPLGLSWDDTDLEPALSVYEESKTVFLVLGSADGPLQVSSHDEVDAVFNDVNIRLAEKVC